MTAQIVPGEEARDVNRLLAAPDRRSRARRRRLLASKASDLVRVPAPLAPEGAAGRFEADLLALAEAGR